MTKKKKVAAESESVDEFIKDATSSMDARSKAKYEEFRARRGTEKELWHAWDAGGRKEKDLTPLLKSVEPLINAEVRKRMQGLGGSIPQAAVKNELRNAAVKAFERYNPEKSQLSTHLITNFQRVTDFIAGGRNQLYVPRKEVEQHQKLWSARDQLADELGREPTPEEIQRLLPGVGLRRIKRMSKAFSPEVFSGMGTDIDDAPQKVDVRDAFLLVRPHLNETQRQFGELHYPPPGEPQVPVSSIAKQLKLPQHRAYQIKNEVERRLEKIMKRE